MAVKLGPNDLTQPNPRPRVRMVGEDGNVFSIFGRVRRAFREIGRLDLYEEFHAEAIKGDYDQVLGLVMRYCDVD